MVLHIGSCGTRFARQGVGTGDRRYVEGIHLGTHSCPLCGNDAPKGHRYCTDCDTAGSYAVDSRAERRSAPPARRGSNVPLILLFFVLSAFGTVLAGIFAPAALSLPILGDVAAPAAATWGEVRVARVTSNIRAQASTSSRVIAQLTTGDSVRVEPVAGGWLKVYDAALVPRGDAKPLGFVFGSLLESTGDVQVARQAEDPEQAGS